MKPRRSIITCEKDKVTGGVVIEVRRGPHLDRLFMSREEAKILVEMVRQTVERKKMPALESDE